MHLSMDLVRRLSDQAPALQDFHDSKPTLLVSWWCTCFAITVIIFRSCGRYVRAEKVFREDGVMLLTIIPILIRMAFVHVVLLYGTNNTVTTGLTAIDIRHREIGSKLVLASRIMYAASLWTMKYSASLFLRSMTEKIWKRSHQRILLYIHILLVVTFLAIVISDLAACRPFQHYWQVIPDPGPQCRQGYAQFLTMTTANIITNLALAAFPIPMIVKSRISKKEKYSILIRMALPLAEVAVTIYQMSSVLSRHGDQQFRSLIASIDLLSATFSMNAVVLVSLLQDKGYKKTKYKHFVELKGAPIRNLGSSHRNRNSRWGSDEDLMGMRFGDAKSQAPSSESIPLEKLPKPAPPVKMQEIRVNSTWEVEVEDRDST